MNNKINKLTESVDSVLVDWRTGVLGGNVGSCRGGGLTGVVGGGVGGEGSPQAKA